MALPSVCLAHSPSNFSFFRCLRLRGTSLCLGRGSQRRRRTGFLGVEPDLLAGKRWRFPAFRWRPFGCGIPVGHLPDFPGIIVVSDNLNAPRR